MRPDASFVWFHVVSATVYLINGVRCVVIGVDARTTINAVPPSHIEQLAQLEQHWAAVLEARVAQRSGECSFLLAGFTWCVYTMVHAAKRSDHFVSTVRQYIYFHISLWSVLALVAAWNVFAAPHGGEMTSTTWVIVCGSVLRLAWNARRVEPHRCSATPV